MLRSQPSARDPSTLSKEDLRDKEKPLKCYYEKKNRCSFVLRVYNLGVPNNALVKQFEIPVKFDCFRSISAYFTAASAHIKTGSRAEVTLFN